MNQKVEIMKGENVGTLSDEESRGLVCLCSFPIEDNHRTNEEYEGSILMGSSTDISLSSD